MINIQKKLVLIASLFLTGYVLAEPQDEGVNLDKFFRYDINLNSLINNNKVLNLMAQMKTPGVTTDNVNKFNEFVAVGSEPLLPRPATAISLFDKKQTILDQFFSPLAWVGAIPITQQEIPSMSFQEGLTNAKRCMEKQGYDVPDQIARFVIFRVNIPTQDFVYDYVFHYPNKPTNECQEVVYLPEENTCKFGLIVSCHYKLGQSPSEKK